MLERRRILEDRMTEIPNRIMLSDVHEVHVKRKIYCNCNDIICRELRDFFISGSARSGGENRLCIEAEIGGSGLEGHRCAY